MERLQVVLDNPTYLTALAGFLAAVIAAFVAGYVLGRAGRTRGAPRPAPRAGGTPRAGRPEAPPALREAGDMAPLPEIGGDEAQLMDLTAIRAAEAEPPPPIDPQPPPLR